MQKEKCWKCQDTGEVDEPVCGHCQAGTIHSSCDDTWMVKILCDVCSEEDIKKFPFKLDFIQKNQGYHNSLIG